MSSTRSTLSRFAVRWALRTFVVLASAACSHLDDALTPARDDAGPPPSIPRTGLLLDHAAEERILALTPEHISDAEVKDVLALAPAPRIINLQGLALVTMEPFAEFLIAMGYPEERIRNPRDGALSYSSFVDSAKLAGSVAWYYENEGMMPMLIGHSQGGMIVVRVLHELAGDFGHAIAVWNPLRDEAENRTWIVDPITEAKRPVLGLKIPYGAAIATGSLMRVLLGQWDMLPRLHQIPDTVVEFTGYSLKWDIIAGNFGHTEPFRAIGSAKVRNVVLPSTANHIELPFAKNLALDPTTRAWINDYAPSRQQPPPDTRIDVSNLLHAADIWYSVKKHWCIEAQRMILARRDEGATPR